MVQVEPNLSLTLKHVSRCGAVLPCEALVRASCDAVCPRNCDKDVEL